MWRRRGRLPHAVDATSRLTEVCLPTCSPDGRTEGDLRLAQSLAVIRAVNGLVDPQQQSYYAGSVLAIAGRLGLPGWIVELRHDATHSELPSLSVLRSAISTLLTWYDEHYWHQQANHLRELCASVCSNDVKGDVAIASLNGLSLTSCDVIVPQLFNDILYFETEIDTSIILQDIPQQDLMHWFKASRWRASFDNILSRYPQWGPDCLTGYACSRLFDAFVILSNLQVDSDPKSEDETMNILKLCEWRIFLLTSCVAYSKVTAGAAFCGPFTTSVLDKRRCTEDPILCPLLNLFQDVSCKGKRKFNSKSHDTLQVPDSNRSDNKNNQRSSVFKPVVWPLGSIPGELNATLLDIEEVFESEKAEIISENGLAKKVKMIEE